jgi:hypothetical protein
MLSVWARTAKVLQVGFLGQFFGIDWRPVSFWLLGAAVTNFVGYCCDFLLF